MFKRLTKFNQQRERDAARGIDVSQDAPPEVMMDEESGSDSENESESEESDSGSEDGEEGGENPRARSLKRKASEEEESGSDGEDNASEAESDAESETSSILDDSIPPISISQSLQSPFYISATSPLKAGEPWTTCLVCPLAQLKSSTALQVHEGSKAHKRRYQRYIKYVDERLTDVEKENDFEVGGADPRGVVREIEGEVERRKEKTGGAGALKNKPPVQQQRQPPATGSDKAQARRERRKANKKAWKQAKEERRRERKTGVQGGDSREGGEEADGTAGVDIDVANKSATAPGDVKAKKPKKAKQAKTSSS